MPSQKAELPLGANRTYFFVCVYLFGRVGVIILTDSGKALPVSCIPP